MIPWIFRMDVPRGGMQTHQVWTAKKYVLGSGHNSLGGPMMLDISLVRIGTDRKVLSKICRSSLRRCKNILATIQALTHQQEQNVSIDGHGSAAPVTPRASPKPVLQSKRPARDKADGDDSSRKFVTVPSDVVVGADDDDLCIDQLDHPLDVQRGVEQELL